MLLFLIAFSYAVAWGNHNLKVFVSNEDIAASNKNYVSFYEQLGTERPTLKPVSKACYISGQSEPVAYGAYCVSGNQPCVENPCPAGSTSED